MPAKLPFMTEQIENRARQLGRLLRQKRKALKVSATAAAEAAGMSRIT
ncbi:MAG: XRE family transcriptional regulator, partial [Bacteroidetes bacterium]